MVVPLIPVGIALLGTAAGVGVASFLGIGGKKDITQAPSEIHATKEHFAPVDSRAFTDQRSWTHITNSPGSTIDFAKKASTDMATETQREQGDAPSAVADITEGTNLSHIAIIGVVGLIAYGVVTKK